MPKSIIEGWTINVGSETVASTGMMTWSCVEKVQIRWPSSLKSSNKGERDEEDWTVRESWSFSSFKVEEEQERQAFRCCLTAETEGV